jgi:Rieske Fe-S protein
VCPCHGCVFDVYGNIVSGPPWAPLPSYTVERIGDRLYLGERK